MKDTILFGGTNKERLVSVASAQALCEALPEADLWFWHVADTVHEVTPAELRAHTRPFEDEFQPAKRGVPLAQALDRAKAESRVLVLGLHGGRAENGELQTMCEVRGVPFTGSGSASSHLAFDKTAAKRFAALGGVPSPEGIDLGNLEEAFAEYGKLIAKPVKDGSSYGLIYVVARQDFVAVRNAARTEEYLIEPLISGTEATCGVLEQSGRQDVLAAADRDRRGRGSLRLHGQISPQVDAGDLSGPLHARGDGRADGSGGESASRAVVLRLFALRFHHLPERAGLPGDQHAAGSDQGLAVSEGAEGPGHRLCRFPA